MSFKKFLWSSFASVCCALSGRFINFLSFRFGFSLPKKIVLRFCSQSSCRALNIALVRCWKTIKIFYNKRSAVNCLFFSLSHRIYTQHYIPRRSARCVQWKRGRWESEGVFDDDEKKFFSKTSFWHNIFMFFLSLHTTINEGQHKCMEELVFQLSREAFCEREKFYFSQLCNETRSEKHSIRVRLFYKKIFTLIMFLERLMNKKLN